MHRIRSIINVEELHNTRNRSRCLVQFFHLVQSVILCLEQGIDTDAILWTNRNSDAY